MKVLVIEDSPEIVDAVSMCFELRWPDSEVMHTDKGYRGITMVKDNPPDVVILDLGLPDLDGFEVLKEIRSFSNVPVAILTVRDAEVDKVRGLELGADDYIIKPFSHLELLARVRAILRRTQIPGHGTKQKIFSSSNLVIDFISRTVTVNKKPVRLTPTEYNLLYYLVLNPNITLTRQALLEKVWGEEYIDSPEYLKVYIQRLRNKIEKDPSNPQLIISERGMGYKFLKSPSA